MSGEDGVPPTPEEEVWMDEVSWPWGVEMLRLRQEKKIDGPGIPVDDLLAGHGPSPVDS